MQDSEGDTDVRNRLLDSVGEGEGGMIWEKHVYYHKMYDQCRLHA